MSTTDAKEEQKQDATKVSTIAAHMDHDITQWLTHFTKPGNSPNLTAQALFKKFTDLIPDDLLLRRGKHAAAAKVHNWKHHQILGPLLTIIIQHIDHHVEGPGTVLVSREDDRHCKEALRIGKGKASQALEQRFRKRSDPVPCACGCCLVHTVHTVSATRVVCLVLACVQRLYWHLTRSRTQRRNPWPTRSLCPTCLTPR